MKRKLECSVCGSAGFVLTYFDVAIEDVPEELRDIELHGTCPQCGREATLSIRRIIRNSQEELDANRFGS